MRKGSVAVCVLFLLIAAVIGWFLPIAKFQLSDRLIEGKQNELQIDQINLSYREELTMNQKLEIARGDLKLSGAIPLDSGIYTQEEELYEIISEFICDFCGRRYYDESMLFSTTPYLCSLEDTKGTAVVWLAYFSTDDYWNYTFSIDDKTGAILDCSVESYYDDDWSGYFPQDAGDYSYVSGNFIKALYNHYTKRLNARLVTGSQVVDEDYNHVKYTYVFRDEKNYTFQINIRCSLYESFIETY